LKLFIKFTLYFLGISTIFLITFVMLGYEKRNFKLNITKIFSSEEEAEEVIKVPESEEKILFLKKFKIISPKDLIISELYEQVKYKYLAIDELNKELESSDISIKPFYISPNKYLIALVKDEEWKPLPTPAEGIEHKLDWQLPEWETHLRIYGRQVLGFTVGDSHYLQSPKSLEARARSSAVNIGFKPDQSLEIHIQGKVGKKVTIQIDSSGRQEVDTYKVEYKALEKEEFIQQIIAGNIGVSIPGSAFASGSGGGTKSAFGIQALAQKDDFKFQAFASMTRGITEVQHFKGASQIVTYNIPVYNYEKNKYFILNNGNPIAEGSVRVYIDDNNGNNNFNTIPFYYSISNQTFSNQCDLQYNGKDYIIDYRRGILVFLKYIYSTYNVFITFDKGDGTGPLIYTNTPYYNISVTNTFDPTKRYVFLYKAGTPVLSPYEYRGIYQLSHRNIQKNDKDFKLYIIDKNLQKVDVPSFSMINSETYQYGTGYGGYYIDEINGRLIFDRSEPFSFLGSLFHYDITYTADDLVYYIHIEYRYETKTFQLRWNIIPESEMVFVDGRKLVRNVDYTIDYDTGYLEFKSDRVVITPETEIDIVYDYYPFGGALQQILAGLRVDYEPYNWFKLGTVGFYNGKQAPARVPSPYSASDNRWVGSIFGNLSLDKKFINEAVSNVFHTKSVDLPFSLNLSGEYAGSYYNVNSFGQAMLDDFEGTIERLSLSIHQNYWYLSGSRPGTDEEKYRGKLYFLNCYDYDDDYYGNWLTLKEAIDGGRTYQDYSKKPGPYNADEGHLSKEQLEDIESDQLSLVFDYDFENKTNAWVGVIYNQAFSGGRDFRNFSDLVMWVKLQDTDVDDASVKVEIDIGEFSEDLDNDGVLDEEKSKDDSGFLFNPLNGVNTYIGGGPGGDYPGNNRIDSEDLNGNKQLDRIINERYITLPTSDNNYALLETGENNLIIKKGDWRLIRINLNKDALNQEQLDILKSVKHIRIRIIKNKGNRGKLLINEIYFLGLTWRDIKINETSVNTNNQKYFRVYPISTYDSETYRKEQLRNYAEDEFDDLHGSLSDIEAAQLNEQALVLEYNNLKTYNFSTTVASNTNNKYCIAYANRYYSSPIDFRYYKKIKFWVYVPALPNNRKGEYIFLRFGTVNNYYEYRKKIDWTGWKKLEIDMRSKEFESLQLVEGFEGKYTSSNPNYKAVGIPNLLNVNQISIGIYGSEYFDGATGWVWINDLYLDEVDKKADKAYSISGSFNIDGHLGVNASHTYKGKDFSSVGGVGSGVETKNSTIGVNWSTIQWAPVSASYSESETKSDVNQIFVPINQQGLTRSKTYSIATSPKMSAMPGFNNFFPQYWPNFNIQFSKSISSNLQPLPWVPQFTKYLLRQNNISENFGISGSVSKVLFLDTILGINASLNANYRYSLADTDSITYTKNPTNIYSYNSRTNYSLTKSIGQGISGNLSKDIISLNSSYNYNYRLSKSSTNEIILNKTNWNLNSRSRNFSLGLSMGKILIFNPSMNYQLSYNESGFYYKNNKRTIQYNGDDPSKIDDDPNLYKNATLSQSLSPSIGSFNFNFWIFKYFTPSYSRSMGLTQNNISATNNLMNTFKQIGWEFIYLPPGYFFYIPLINEHYNSFKFVRKFKNEKYSSSVSLNNSFSASFGLELTKWSSWAFNYSFSQNTSRNADSYQFSTSWSLNGNSSLNLMDLFNFWIWRQTGSYRKSSTLSYGFNFRESNNQLQQSLTRSLSLPFSFNYRWSADNAIGFNLTYSLNKTIYEKYEEFYKILDDDFKEEEPQGFGRKLNPNIPPFPDRIDVRWNFSTSYSFKTKLPELWQPPLLFKKPIKLGFDLNHTTTLSFMRHTYDYGGTEYVDFIHPKETLFQIGVNHSITFAISKNIDGGGNLKLFVEQTREETGNKGNENDDKELILSWELGMKVTIRF